jgi:hypothetical protein
MKLMAKNTKELLQVLDENKPSSKTKNAATHTQRGNTNEPKSKSDSTDYQNTYTS